MHFLTFLHLSDFSHTSIAEIDNALADPQGIVHVPPLLTFIPPRVPRTQH